MFNFINFIRSTLSKATFYYIFIRTDIDIRELRSLGHSVLFFFFEIRRRNSKGIIATAQERELAARQTTPENVNVLRANLHVSQPIPIDNGGRKKRMLILRGFTMNVLEGLTVVIYLVSNYVVIYVISILCRFNTPPSR